jgi:hypothetical protein
MFKAERNSMGLSRKQIREGLAQVPIDQVLGVSGELTTKQKRFAAEVASGSTKADAYRKAYKPTATKRTLASKPYELARDERIQREIEAYKMANEAAKYRSAQQLRDLVIQSLVQVVIDPDAKPAVKVQAAKVLGTVTEVAAFTERKEITTIKTSIDARAQLMQQLREMVKASAVDAVEVDALSLMQELAPITPSDDPHPGGTPHIEPEHGLDHIHTIPHEQSPADSDLPEKSDDS